MSYDLYFVNPGLPFRESMELLEQQQSTGELSDEQLAVWEQLVSQIQADLPDITVSVGPDNARLEDPVSHAGLSFHAGGTLVASAPQWYDGCCVGAARGATFALFSAVVEDVTGRVAYDPQTDGCFNQFSVQRFDHDPWQGELVTFVSPEPANMTALRKLKDEDERRRLAYVVAANAPIEWLVNSQRNAVTWLAELAMDREPYEPKRAQVALRYGQQMHKRNGSDLTSFATSPSCSS